uniref:Protein kinase domain-containing protein n=2 Tax=Physcomitrium patens TaxID=3218 RepID=A0A7I4CXT0_PHYPA
MGLKLGVGKYSLVHQSCFVAALIVLLGTLPTCDGQNTTIIFDSNQVDALKDLLRAWNQTPNLETNLAGWDMNSTFPCFDKGDWRGVQCLNFVNCTSYGEYQTCYSYIIGVTLQSASLVGSIPPTIGNITSLYRLELTGNPNLTGPLPRTLNETSLSILDVHDNALEGEFPHYGVHLLFLVTLDLSGNKFNGSFPISQISQMEYLQTLRLGRNRFKGPVPERAFENMTNLFDLDLSSNKFNGTLPNLTMIHSLRTVNLSRSGFTGSFLISSYFNRTENNSLSVLDISHNPLTLDQNFWSSYELGSLQELYLDNIRTDPTLNISRLYDLGLLMSKNSTANSSMLTVLSLMNNSIRNVVYDAKSIVDSATVIWKMFCAQTCINSVPMQESKRKITIIAVVVSVTSSLILMISLAILFHRHKKLKQYQLLVQQKFEEFEVKPTIFTHSQLRTATRDFHPDLKLGEGAFGRVYKGILPNGNVMAVKLLFPQKTSKGLDEFLNEVVLLTGMKHRNLVNLRGCCIREQQRLLVYEYVDNYDVDQVLLGGANKADLSWPVRWKIVLGVARGLHYLHALAHPRIIHRDIKASNILLTKNYDTKIADFGLALLFPDEQSCIVTKHVAGTKGYLAPEYASCGRLSDKVDVYSFGVLCLEIVSGRRNIDDSYPPGEMYLSKWVWDLHRQGKLVDSVDRTMNLRDEEKVEVLRVINIGLLCIQNEAEERPGMERVVAMLQGESEAEVVALKPGNEGNLLESTRLFAGCSSDLGTVKEEGE